MIEFRDGLKDEIEFWRELLQHSELSQASQEYIRMQQALQFAQSKLSDCELALIGAASHSVEH